MTRIPPICPYCMTPANLVDSAVIYGRSFGNAWVCGNYPDCDAYVGVHKATDEPLGRLADAELRQAKKRAHAAFDPLWIDAVSLYGPIDGSPKDKKKAAGRIRRRARKRAYAWLAEQLDINPDDCHIGFFSVEECKAEGVEPNGNMHGYLGAGYRPAFRELWEHTNGPGAWERNDWCWCLHFRVIEANVDDVLADPALYGIGEVV